MEFTFLENILFQIIFTYAPPHSKLASKIFSSCHRQKEITHSSKQHSLENLFPSTADSVGGNYDLLYQNSIRKYEDDSED